VFPNESSFGSGNNPFGSCALCGLLFKTENYFVFLVFFVAITRHMKREVTRISAYGLVHEPGRILLCRVAPQIDQWAGWWTLPGGGLQFGEEPETAAIREVEEETGLRVRLRGLARIHTLVDRSLPDYDFHGLRLIYHTEVLGGTLRHETSGTTDRCEWFALDAVPNQFVELARIGVELVVAAQTDGKL